MHQPVLQRNGLTMDLAQFNVCADHDLELSLRCRKCWTTIDCPDGLVADYTGTSLVTIMRLAFAHAATCPGEPGNATNQGDDMTTDTPIAIVQRINAHLANLEYPADGWAEAAESIADDYRAELAGGEHLQIRDVAERHEAACTAAITRWEESLTDVS